MIHTLPGPGLLPPSGAGAPVPFPGRLRRKTCHAHTGPVSSDADGWAQPSTTKSRTGPLVSSGGYIRYSNGVHGYFTAGPGVEFEVCGNEAKIRVQNNGREVQSVVLSHHLRDSSGPYLGGPR